MDDRQEITALARLLVDVCGPVCLMLQAWRWSRTARRCLRACMPSAAEYAAQQAQQLNNQLVKLVEGDAGGDE